MFTFTSSKNPRKKDVKEIYLKSIDSLKQTEMQEEAMALELGERI